VPEGELVVCAGTVQSRMRVAHGAELSTQLTLD
jgi:hypothetical protein